MIPLSLYNVLFCLFLWLCFCFKVCFVWYKYCYPHTLATWCRELTHLKRPWCWERLRAGGEGDDRGWDGWTASPTQWTWVWVDTGSWWWTGRPSVLQFMGLQSKTRLSNWTDPHFLVISICMKYLSISPLSVWVYFLPWSECLIDCIL